MLWILSEVYYPDEAGSGYYITKIAQHLADRLPVSVLCTQPSYSQNWVRAAAEEVHQQVRIVRCATPSVARRGLLSRLVRMAVVSLNMLLAALSRIRPGDQILAVTNPPSVPILACLVASLKRVPYTLILHDIHPDMVAACGMMSSRSLVYRVLRRLNRYVLRRAQHIFCIGRDMAEYLVTLRGMGGSRGIHVIPIWSDSEEVFPEPRSENKLLRELGLMDKFVVLWAGNMGHPQGVETLAGAIRLLKDDPQIHFLLLGSGPKAHLLTELRASGCGNFTLLPPRPRTAQSSFLNACDLSILGLVPGMYGLAVPSRTYNVMAAGKPVIAIVSNASEIDRLVMEEQIGWVVEPGSAEQAADAICAAKNHPEWLAEMGKRARYAAETRYARETVLTQFDPFFLI